MTSPEDINPPPWYKQFWPWFLISIPAGTIVAAMFTINIAIKSNDGLVSENYYKEGLAIHRDADALLKARELGIQADIDFNLADQVVQVSITSDSLDAIGALQLHLRHPTRADKDASLDLQPTGPNTFQVAMPDLTSTHHWNVELTASDTGWQLPGRLDLQQSQHLQLR